FIQSHLQEGLCQFQVCSQFSTDSNQLSFCMGIVRRHLNHPQYGWMVRVIEVIQLLVLPVECQSILAQVLCSHTEEIDVFCEFTADHNGGRSLYHNTDFYIFPERNSGFSQLSLYLFNDFLNPFYL